MHVEARNVEFHLLGCRLWALFRMLLKMLWVFADTSQVFTPGFFLLTIQANLDYGHEFRMNMSISVRLQVYLSLHFVFRIQNLQKSSGLAITMYKKRITLSKII